ncbi:TCP-1/cpn60 chaperonin family protein [Candidatus Bathyarchaeota archaeon]|nr:TCP-1/cpn60 chaperonin family protein [Candidatus Bathyarchaeota archaeon]
MAGTPVLILKEGSTRERGRGAQRNNIAAAMAIAEALKSSLGPKGMDKMLVDSFGDVTITSDGRTILDEMDVQHPAAKMMVEVAKAQDQEVGDGTTSVVVLAGELLNRAQMLMDKQVHPSVILDGYRKASEKALQRLEDIAIPVDPRDREYLRKVAMTSMASKLVAGNKEQLAEIAVEAILKVSRKEGDRLRADLDDVAVIKKPGESLTDTRLVDGVIIDKEVVHPRMPKRVEKAKIALVNKALEVKKTEFDAKINIESPEEIEAFLMQEEEMLRSMVEKVKAAGANVLFCQKGIDDVAQHFLARSGIMAVKQVKESDMEKLAKATEGRVVTSYDDLRAEDLGYAELVEERKIGDDKMVFVEGCKDPKAVSILIRGGSERIVDEAERSIHDALSVVRDVVQEPKVVAGGGAPEVEVSRAVREYAVTLPGREQLALEAFAEAFEIIPMTLAENAGLDPIDTLSEIKAKHEKGEIWVGVDVLGGCVGDMKEIEVIEPLAVKKQIVKSASEAAAMILKIDDVIAAAKMKPPKTPPGGGEEGMPEKWKPPEEF